MTSSRLTTTWTRTSLNSGGKGKLLRKHIAVSSEPHSAAQAASICCIVSFLGKREAPTVRSYLRQSISQPDEGGTTGVLGPPVIILQIFSLIQCPCCYPAVSF
jgi:hypothetical protein